MKDYFENLLVDYRKSVLIASAMHHDRDLGYKHKVDASESTKKELALRENILEEFARKEEKIIEVSERVEAVIKDMYTKDIYANIPKTNRGNRR